MSKFTNDEYEELHKKLGADKLAKDERKELFDKFVDHGGEVIKPTAKEQVKSSTSSKTRQIREIQSQKSGYTRSDKKTSSTGVKKTTSKKQSSDSSFFDNLSLHLNAYFSGVTTFFGKKLKKNFISSVKTSLKTDMVTLNSIITFILNPKKGDTKLFKGMMIQQNAYFYELLRLSKQMYQSDDFELLTSKSASSTGDLDFLILEDPISKIYRKLYLFWPHAHQLKSAVQLGLDTQVEHNKLNDQIYGEYLNSCNNIIKSIFEDYFIKLHWAFCRIVGKNIFVNDQDKIKELLQISESETVEILIQQLLIKREDAGHDKEEIEIDGETSSEEETDKVKEEEEEKKVELPTDYIEGKSWIESLNFSKDKITEKDPKYYFDEKDKIFKVYVILEEFEKEFSFILTSNKIKFNIDWYEGKKMDFKKELSDLYLGINACHDNIKAYIEILKQIHKIENNPSGAIGSRNEQINKLQLNQTRISNITRTRLLDITRSIDRLLRWAADKGDTIIQAANEKLYFDTLDGKKKVENKTATDAVRLCSSYIGYLRHLLEYGELYGSSPKNE
ncbi:MAG: hypothetical protein OEV44_10430 [Spirochaetota bacterium]|nr:hypothetical protein [Spirochaetota bacterium]